MIGVWLSLEDRVTITVWILKGSEHDKHADRMSGSLRHVCLSS